jgi:hypothetical protein
MKRSAFQRTALAAGTLASLAGISQAVIDPASAWMNSAPKEKAAQSRSRFEDAMKKAKEKKKKERERENEGGVRTTVSPSTVVWPTSVAPSSVVDPTVVTTSPATLPVTLPVTLPATLPATFPATLPATTPATTAAPTAPATTKAATTVAPTTAATTVAQTTAPATTAATTVAPTTVAPTTVAPTTVAPTTAAPTTVAPTTVAPTTVVAPTIAPTTLPAFPSVAARWLGLTATTPKIVGNVFKYQLMNTTVTNNTGASKAVTVTIQLSATGALPDFIQGYDVAGTFTCGAYTNSPGAAHTFTCTGTMAAGSTSVIAVSSGSIPSAGNQNAPLGTLTGTITVNPGGSTATITA